MEHTFKNTKTNIDSSKTLIVRSPYAIEVALPDFILRYLVKAKAVAVQPKIPVNHRPAVYILRFPGIKGSFFSLK